MADFRMNLSLAQDKVIYLTRELKAMEQQLTVAERSLLTDIDTPELHNTIAQLQDQGRAMDQSLTAARALEQAAQIVLEEEETRVQERGGIIRITGQGDVRTALKPASDSLIRKYEYGPFVSWEVLDGIVDSASQDAISIADELDLENIYEQVYGVKIEEMITRKQALIGIYGRETVSALDPVICVFEGLVTMLIVEEQSCEVFCRRITALPQHLRAQVMESLMASFRKHLSEHKSPGETWKNFLKEHAGLAVLAAFCGALDGWENAYKQFVNQSEQRLIGKKVRPEVVKTTTSVLLAAWGITPDCEIARTDLARHLLKANSEQRKALLEELQKFGFAIDNKLLSVFLGGWFGRGLNPLASALKPLI